MNTTLSISSFSSSTDQEKKDRTDDASSAVRVVGERKKEWKYLAPAASAFHRPPKKGSLVLKSDVQTRPLQAHILNHVHGVAESVFRSAVVSAPCASGKTLTSLLLASSINRETGCSTLVVVNSVIAAAQVVSQAKKYFAVEEDEVLILSAETFSFELASTLQMPTVVVVTYQFLTHGRSDFETKLAMAYLFALPHFGLVIVDECHSAPAKKFGKVLKLNAPCFVALSATVVRTDDRLRFLFEKTGDMRIVVSRDALLENGTLPPVLRCDVVVSSSTVAVPPELPTLPLGISIPKLAALVMLLEENASLRSGILIFVDRLETLRAVHTFLAVLLASPGGGRGNGLSESLALLPAMTGDTPSDARGEIIDKFHSQATSKSAVLVLSPVGNTSLDFFARVVIEYACCDASLLTTRQRVGRVERVRGGGGDGSGFHSPHLSFTLIDTGAEISRAAERKEKMRLEGYETSTRKFAWGGDDVILDALKDSLSAAMVATMPALASSSKERKRKKSNKQPFASLRRKIG